MSRATVKTRDGREFVLNTPEEDAAITAAAMADPDARPYTDEEQAEARTRTFFGRPPVGHLRELFYDEHGNLRRTGGRPRVERPKTPVTIRLSQDIAEAFRATGKGWQTRMNAALADWLKTHSPMDAQA
jgi:uncharacterized protein (DUF4415 family)